MTPASAVRTPAAERVAALAVGAAEAARLLGVGRRLLSRLTASGDLVSVKIGRRRLYRVADIEAFLAERVEGRP